MSCYYEIHSYFIRVDSPLYSDKRSADSKDKRSGRISVSRPASEPESQKFSRAHKTGQMGLEEEIEDLEIDLNGWGSAKGPTSQTKHTSTVRSGRALLNHQAEKPIITPRAWSRVINRPRQHSAYNKGIRARNYTPDKAHRNRGTLMT
jgi:hypothetical protein